MDEDGRSIFIFYLREDDSFEHQCVLEEMLKDLTKEWADQFVHRTSRYCNIGWPGPCGFSPARAPLGQLVSGHLSLGLLAHVNILCEKFVFSRSVLELWPLVE